MRPAGHVWPTGLPDEPSEWIPVTENMKIELKIGSTFFKELKK
jgi:hypothetical protein